MRHTRSAPDTFAAPQARLLRHFALTSQIYLLESAPPLALPGGWPRLSAAAPARAPHAQMLGAPSALPTMPAKANALPPPRAPTDTKGPPARWAACPTHHSKKQKPLQSKRAPEPARSAAASLFHWPQRTLCGRRPHPDPSHLDKTRKPALHSLRPSPLPPATLPGHRPHACACVPLAPRRAFPSPAERGPSGRARALV
ncbi:MAG: hypothetical protein J3K34DRAFT_411773 [Monoraphidium minutum]|nr:MAG: hypothetical protein J3K34DRAFT_411773 [Monoraphidium minutum]